MYSKSLSFTKIFKCMCVNNTCGESATITVVFGANRSNNIHKNLALEEGHFCMDRHGPLGKDWKTDR